MLKMAKLKNEILEKLASEGRISHISMNEVQDMYKSTHERMNNYKRTLTKREYYSHISAGKLILNS